MQERGFTLLELVVVIVIIGILATLGLVNYGPVKEKTLNKEATINLKLVWAAERIYRLSMGFYYPYSATSPASETNVATINSYLKLLLPAESNRNWDYKVESASTADFKAKFQRTTDQRLWCIDQATEEPYTTGCSW